MKNISKACGLSFINSHTDNYYFILAPKVSLKILKSNARCANDVEASYISHFSTTITCAEAVLDTSICDGGNGVFEYSEKQDGECQCYTSPCEIPYKDHTQYDLYKTESNFFITVKSFCFQ